MGGAGLHHRFDVLRRDVILRLRSHKKRDLSGSLDDAKRSFISILKTELESLLMTCYDADSDLIGLKWNPRAFLPATARKKIKGLPYARSGGKFVPDVVSLLRQILALGVNIVDDVEIH